MEYYSAMKRNAFKSVLMRWMNLEPIILSEVSQKKEHNYCIGSEDKASACNMGDPDSIPGLGRSPGGGNGNPLQYSCLGNPTDRSLDGYSPGVAKVRHLLTKPLPIFFQM